MSHADPISDSGWRSHGLHVHEMLGPAKICYVQDSTHLPALHSKGAPSFRKVAPSASVPQESLNAAPKWPQICAKYSLKGAPKGAATGGVTESHYIRLSYHQYEGLQSQI